MNFYTSVTRPDAPCPEYCDRTRNHACSGFFDAGTVTLDL